MQPNRGFAGSEAPKLCILRWFGGSETVVFYVALQHSGLENDVKMKFQRHHFVTFAELG